MEQEEIQDKVHTIFSAYLEKHKHRKTPERFAILREIYDYKGHFDIESLYVKMKQKNYRVSRATLYNTIDLLLACSLVRKHQFGKNIAQFEKAHQNQQHDHIILTDTSEVLEFCDPRIQQIKSTLEEIFNIEIVHHSLNFYARKKDDGEKDNSKSTDKLVR
ncbi:MAG: Fur family transcriptional regulator [Flavobacteriales bacterium]